MAIPNSHIDYKHIFNMVDWHFNVSQWQHHKSVATSHHLSKRESNYIQTHNNNTTYFFIIWLQLCGVWFGTLFLLSVIVVCCFSYYYLLVYSFICIIVCLIYSDYFTSDLQFILYNCWFTMTYHCYNGCSLYIYIYIYDTSK